MKRTLVGLVTTVLLAANVGCGGTGENDGADSGTDASDAGGLTDAGAGDAGGDGGGSGGGAVDAGGTDAGSGPTDDGGIPFGVPTLIQIAKRAGLESSSVAVLSSGEALVLFNHGDDAGVVTSRVSGDGGVSSSQLVEGLVSTAGTLRLVVDGAGMRHALFTVASASRNQLTLKYGWSDGGTWSIEDVQADAHVNTVYDLRVTPDNTPHVAYRVQNAAALDGGSVSDLVVMYGKRSAGTWSVGEVDRAPGGSGLYFAGALALAVDSQNRPHLAYGGTDNGSSTPLRHATQSAGVWQFEEVATSSIRFTQASLDVGPQDVLYLASRGAATQVRVKKGSTWEVAGGSSSWSNLHLRVSPSGIAYFVHWNGSQIALSRISGSSIVSVPVYDSATDSMPAQTPSLVFDAQGTPHVTYRKGELLAALPELWYARF